ncbi:MAG TPA: SGNH/GDSL hydrolase family protein [Longimicrobium sp.]
MDRRRAIGWMLVLALGLAGCARQGTDTGAGKMKFLALGDSYTIGEGVAAADRWPVQLAALLREQGQDFAEPQIIARTGWTTDELSDAIDAADPRGPYDLVSLLIGVNNQYRGRGTEEYRAEFAGLLQRAIGFAGGDASRVIVLSIPDWGATPFAEGRSRANIAAEIDVFNAINRQETERLGARYVDITPQSRTAGSNPAFLAPDGLHYSGLTYAEWARLALPAALEAVQ